MMIEVVLFFGSFFVLTVACAGAGLVLETVFVDGEDGEFSEPSKGQIMIPIRDTGSIRVFECDNCGSTERANPEHAPRCVYC